MKKVILLTKKKKRKMYKNKWLHYISEKWIESYLMPHLSNLVTPDYSKI